jgi:hypothetical protein
MKGRTVGDQAAPACAMIETGKRHRRRGPGDRGWRRREDGRRRWVMTRPLGSAVIGLVIPLVSVWSAGQKRRLSRGEWVELVIPHTGCVSLVHEGHHPLLQPLPSLSEVVDHHSILQHEQHTLYQSVDVTRFTLSSQGEPVGRVGALDELVALDEGGGVTVKEAQVGQLLEGGEDGTTITVSVNDAKGHKGDAR